MNKNLLRRVQNEKDIYPTELEGIIDHLEMAMGHCFLAPVDKEVDDLIMRIQREVLILQKQQIEYEDLGKKVDQLLKFDTPIENIQIKELMEVKPADKAEVEAVNKPEITFTEEFLETPLEDTEIDGRPVNSLKLAGIHTVGQLIKLNLVELIALKGFGFKSYHSVAAYFDKLGLSIVIPPKAKETKVYEKPGGKDFPTHTIN